MSKYFIITYGCQQNESDSEKIAFFLKEKGHKPAKNENEASLIVINACSVRQAAIHSVYDKISKLNKIGPLRSRKGEASPLRLDGQSEASKKIILAGCLLPYDKEKLKSKVSEFWQPDEYFEMKSETGSKQTAYVPIMTGCNNFCSYCVVPFTRGREKSRPANEIINEIKLLIKNGHKEILLLGQNVNSYSSPSSLRGVSYNGTTKRSRPITASRGIAALVTLARNDNTIINFPKLLKKINALPDKFWLSFMTSHPKDMSDELISTMAECEKLRKEIHLPIQSGDNQILKKMNRRYTAIHYKNLIKKIRQAMPGVKISTDIIVGFPGETKKQFETTRKLAKEINFHKAYIAKYSPRMGTEAAKLKDDVPLEEKKRRWQILDTLINKFKH